jgi:putative transposase
MESFSARLQVELLNTRKWATTLELAASMADYIDNLYNVERCFLGLADLLCDVA